MKHSIEKAILPRFVNFIQYFVQGCTVKNNEKSVLKSTFQFKPATLLKMISFAGVLQRFRPERFATHKIEDSSGSIFAGLYLVNFIGKS